MDLHYRSVRYPCHSIGIPIGYMQQLRATLSQIRSARNGPLVSKTLAGLQKRFTVPVKQKRALSVDEVKYVQTLFHLSNSLDDRLFVCIFTASFHALHRLGELCWSDEPNRRDYRRVIMRPSVQTAPDFVSYLLPAHKTDMSCSGNTIRLQCRWPSIDPLPIFNR